MEKVKVENESKIIENGEWKSESLKCCIINNFQFSTFNSPLNKIVN